MRQYFLNDHWIFDAGNHLGGTATGPALLHVDIENPLEPLSPGHGRMTLNRGFLVLATRSFGLAAFAPLCRRNPCSMLTVGCEYAVKPNQIDSRLGDQGGQLGDEVYRL